MLELMERDWNVQFFKNKLDTYTAIATKGDAEVVSDVMPTQNFFALTQAIINKVLEYEALENKDGK